MRFTNGRRGIAPPGGFIGGSPIRRSRPGPAAAVQALPVGAYPSSSLQMASAIGWGRWDYGWLADETTGSLTASFAPFPLALQFDATRGGNVLYGTPGWLGGSDLAAGFTASSRNSRFDGGTNFNIPAGADLLVGYVGKWQSVPVNFGNVFGRVDAAFAKGWALNGNDGTNFTFSLWDGGFVGGAVPGGSAGFRAGEWHVGICAFDRANGNVKFGIRSLDTGVTLLSTDSFSLNNTPITASSNFYYGATAWVPANETFSLAALYMSTGSQVATGVLPNITQALENFARQMGGVVTGAFDGRSSLVSRDTSNELSVAVSGAVFRSIGRHPRTQFTPFSPVVSTSSLVLDGSISRGKRYERGKLNATLLGLSSFAVDAAPFPSPTVMDLNPTGTFVSPSWTHASIGVNQSYVISSLSSSDVENRAYNTFTSGTQPLEQSAVPASGTLYFSKEQRLQTIVVKKTASFFDTLVRSGSWVPQSFSAPSGCLFSQVTGVAENALVPGEGGTKASSVWAPASILVPVNVSGRIVDVKVWVELIQGSSSADPFPLGNLGLALRSPNLTWGNAHPIRNDPNLVRVYTSPGDTFSWLAGIHEGFRRMYAGTGSNVNRFYKDTFILWEGPAIFDGGALCNMPTVNAIDGGQFGKHFAVWQKDRGMRTVFSDGGAVPNPRQLFGSPSGNFLGSPNAGVSRTSAFGADVPWTSEAGLKGSQQFALAGSPPSGWLTGPGGVANVNEWPTTGVNYGTNSIKPLYPLLDTIFCKKRVTDEALPASGTTNSTVPESYRPDLWVGFRPGLRGTEVSGTWELLLVAGGSFIDDPVPNWYFRQVRLEFILETPTYTRASRFTRRRQPLKSTGAPRIIQSISGSDSVLSPPLLATTVAGWDYWITDVYASFDAAGEIGRSFGLRLKTGSVPADTALTYRLTGALADIVGNTPAWLLGGPGGMPSIPESSASLVPVVPQPITSVSPASFLQPRRLLDLPQRLQDIAADQNPAKTLRQLATEFAVTSST